MISRRVLMALDFHRIVAMLADRTATPYGREAAVDLVPADDIATADRRQALTEEAVLAIDKYRCRITGSAPDIRVDLSRARRGAVLEPERLQAISAVLGTAGQIKAAITNQEQGLALLAQIARNMDSCPGLRARIERAIGADGEVRDDASEALGKIRRQKRLLHSRIRDRMDNMAKSSGLQAILQEPVVMIREDRYVLPVRQEKRSALKGIVHDRSASGQTVFMEPLAVVGMNNALRQKSLEEKSEVEAIMRQLSDLVTAAADTIEASVGALARLDLWLACGYLALKMNAYRPRLNGDGVIDIRRGRHPLIEGDVVPIDIKLGSDYLTLVITGPNTGGKTVALKTVGLFTLMAQAGLHVPAAEGSTLAVFSAVACDIGDEQSIEQSLSTFSSHMKNIVDVVHDCGPDSLVLLDEIGVGTDPKEGAALAMAVLERLTTRGARIIATTHYDELKTFAFSADGMENAAVEFDPETLAPKYRLVTGVPGASWALDIAKRLGMPGEIIDRARSFLSDEHVQTDVLIRGLEDRRRMLDQELEQARLSRTEAARVRDQVMADKARLEEKAGKTMDQVRAESRRIIKHYRALYEQEIEQLSARLDELALEGVRSERDRVGTRVRDRLQAIDGKLKEDIAVLSEAAGERERKPVEQGTIDRIEQGLRVMVRSVAAVGQVIDVDSDGQSAVVQIGAAKMRVGRADLAPAPQQPRSESRSNVGELSLVKARMVPPELMIRGLTVEDALYVLESYLDDAVLAGHRQVTIIHGKGTGTLRQAVRNLLREKPRVEDFRPGLPAEGGDGVTVIRLA